jgi:deoxyribodipyrimidine photo-lyase
VRPITWRKGGTVQAKALLAAFMRDKLKKYRFDRKEMHKRHVSYLSAYIHFGQISTLYVAQRVRHMRSHIFKKFPIFK